MLFAKVQTFGISHKAVRGFSKTLSPCCFVSISTVLADVHALYRLALHSYSWLDCELRTRHFCFSDLPLPCAIRIINRFHRH